MLASQATKKKEWGERERFSINPKEKNCPYRDFSDFPGAESTSFYLLIICNKRITISKPNMRILYILRKKEAFFHVPSPVLFSILHQFL